MHIRPTPVDVRLDADERLYVSLAAMYQAQRAIDHGVARDYDQAIYAALVEAAVAKELNRIWWPGTAVQRDRVQHVRVEADNMALLFHLEDRDEGRSAHVFWLVTGDGADGRFGIRGWATGQEITLHGRWRRWQPGRPECWGLPWPRLHPLSTRALHRARYDQEGKRGAWDQTLPLLRALGYGVHVPGASESDLEQGSGFLPANLADFRSGGFSESAVQLSLAGMQEGGEDG